jgi:outer membrane autotransporter protein
LRTGTAIAWHRIDTSRSIVFPGFVDQATANYSGRTGQVFGEVGYGTSLWSTAFEPFAGLAVVHVHTGSFAETGGLAALAGARVDKTVGYSSLGARAATNYVLRNGAVLVPHASVAWQHALSDITPSETLAFQNPGVPFLIAGVPLARDSALIDAGADWRVTRAIRTGVAYSGQLSSRVHDHGVKGNFTWDF